jgi:hypothetical protein
MTKRNTTTNDLLDAIESIKTTMATKDDLKGFATKDDIKSIRSEMATKDDFKEFAKKSDLKQFATKDDLKKFGTKDDLKKFATKDDFKDFAKKEDLKSFATKDDLNGFMTKDDLDASESRTSAQILEILEFMRDNLATKDDQNSLKDELYGAMGEMEHRILDAIDDKLADLKGDLIVVMRKGDYKLGELIDLLRSKKVITDKEAKRLRILEPFPKS